MGLGYRKEDYERSQGTEARGEPNQVEEAVSLSGRQLQELQISHVVRVYLYHKHPTLAQSAVERDA